MGRWGGMAGDIFPPQQSTIKLLTDGRMVGTHDVRWDFDTINVHPGTLFVIQNLVHFFHLNGSPIASLMLRTPWVRDGSAVDEELPCDYEPHPFAVHYAIESSRVLVDVDFKHRQEPLSAEPFREAWDAWYEVASHGGFCSEDYPPNEAKIFIEDDLQVTSTGIGGVFEDIAIDDAAFYCLINMLQVLHHRLAPIDKLTIE